jgi:hypothetical protein
VFCDHWQAGGSLLERAKITEAVVKGSLRCFQAAERLERANPEEHASAINASFDSKWL